MSEFNHSRALVAAAAFWMCGKFVEAFLAGVVWLVNITGVYAVVPLQAITILAVCGLLVVWISCSLWYCWGAAGGLLYGTVLGFTFSCVMLVMTAVEN